MTKILIMCPYWNRPLLLRNALRSILNSGYDDWVLGFVDDASSIPGRPIVEEILADHLDKVIFMKNQMTLEEKLENGLILGTFANQFIAQTDADIALVLCDDDELYPSYLHNLAEYFKQEDVLYCYSKIILFNPLLQKASSVFNLDNKYNRWQGPVDPAGRLDTTQVAWRTVCCKEYGAWYPQSTKVVPGKPWTFDTDRGFFGELYERCGLCYPTGFISEYKGVHDYQLVWHKNVGEEALRSYVKLVEEKAGVLF